MVFHRNLTGLDVHSPISFIYPDIIARTSATGFTSLDIGKLAWQQDNNSFWILTSITPTWQTMNWFPDLTQNKLWVGDENNKPIEKEFTPEEIGAIPIIFKGTNNGVAELDNNGKVPATQLPSIVVTNVYVVANYAERDDLTVETGDVAKVTSDNRTYIWDGSQWIEITVDHAVDSVNGQIGDVNLSTGDIPEGSNLYYTDDRVSANLSVLANTSKVSADGSVTTHNDVFNAGSGFIITDSERVKLNNIEQNAKDDQIASEVPFNPNGDLSSVNVQDAIVELRDDTDQKLAELIPIYLDRYYHRDTTELVTTSTSFIDFFNLNVPIAHNNKRYKITLSYIWSHNDNGNDIETELLIDGVRVMFHKEEPKDSGGQGVGGTNQRHVVSFILTQELASGNRNFQFRFRTDSNGDESAIHGADLTIERWME